MVTILYYTSNGENEAFEKKVVDKLKENCGDLPIVSVSQKPMELGRNICVGNIGKSYFSEFRQIMIGLRNIDTKYVLVAESDTIYPKGYFKFKPDNKTCYRYDNVWVLNTGKEPKYLFKRQSHCAQMIERKVWLKRIERMLYDGWDEAENKKKGRSLQLRGRYINCWTTSAPVVTFKTGKGMRAGTHTKKDVKPKTTLPYWGSADKLIKQFV